MCANLEKVLKFLRIFLQKMGELCDKLRIAFANHYAVLTNGIWNQFESGEETDLIIICSGGQKIKIHRWLIHIFVPHLLSNFKANSINLNIDYSTLVQILEFLYKGVVLIPETDLGSFRAGAEFFQLKHLLEAIKNHVQTPNPGCHTHAKTAVTKLASVKKSVKASLLQVEEVVNEQDNETTQQETQYKVVLNDEEESALPVGSEDPQQLEREPLENDQVLCLFPVTENSSVQNLMEKAIPEVNLSIQDILREHEYAGVADNQYELQQTSLNEELVPVQQSILMEGFSSELPTASLGEDLNSYIETTAKPSELICENGTMQVYSLESDLNPDQMICFDEQSVVDVIEEEVTSNSLENPQCVKETSFNNDEILNKLNKLGNISTDRYKVLSVTKVTVPLQSLLRSGVRLSGTQDKLRKLLRLQKTITNRDIQSLKAKKLALKIIRSKGLLLKQVQVGQSAVRKKRRMFCNVKVRCAKCEHVANNILDLDQHLHSEHGESRKAIDRRRRCTMCDFTAEHMSTLFLHLKTEHKDSLNSDFKCEHCDFVTNKKGFLSRHVRYNHSGERPFACDKCEYRGTTKKHLSLHTQLHMEKKYACETCGKLFNCQIYLRKHRKMHSEMRFPCPLCSHPFRQKQSLKLHLQRIHNLGNETLELLQNLVPKNMPIPKIKCPLCEYTVPQRKFLVNHLAGQHQKDEHLNPIEPTISCPACEFTCYIPSQLTAHHFKVHKKYPQDQKKKVQVACDICGNVLSSVPHLKRHIKMMHTENPILEVCPICGFATKTKGNLKQHIKRKHDG